MFSSAPLFAQRAQALDARRHHHGLVCRIVVADMHSRRRHRRTEIGDHPGDRTLFVVAGHQDRHLMVRVDHIFGNTFAA